jgi:hypothetical protein
MTVIIDKNKVKRKTLEGKAWGLRKIEFYN